MPWVSGGGGSSGGSTELVYTQVTANQTSNQTVAANSAVLITASAYTFTGAQIVIVEFFCGAVWNDTGTAFAHSWLFMDGSISDQLTVSQVGLGSGNAQFHYGRVRLTPSAGSHTFSVRGQVSTNTCTWAASVQGSGGFAPMFIRIATA